MIDIEISTDPSRLDVALVHNFLSQHGNYAKGIPLEIVRQSIENSLCFGVYAVEKQVGFARVITDKATFGYLADVFILPPYRGKGLSKRLMQVIMEHQELQGLRRWLLITDDAHELYAPFGFAPIPNPGNFMGISKRNMYRNPEPAI